MTLDAPDPAYNRRGALERRPPLSVRGADYNTRDGTAIRDYTHFDDLASTYLAFLVARSDRFTAEIGWQPQWRWLNNFGPT